MLTDHTRKDEWKGRCSLLALASHLLDELTWPGGLAAEVKAQENRRAGVPAHAKGAEETTESLHRQAGHQKGNIVDQASWQQEQSCGEKDATQQDFLH